jgi:hypothetical protein
LLVATLWSSSVSGQELAVQQPVFGVTGVATTVSVPDRGRVGLGAISRGGAAQSSSGFGWRQRGRSSFTEQSSLSVSATIHDFDELDRAALAAPPMPSRSRRELSPRAESAWQTLSNRHAR